MIIQFRYKTGTVYQSPNGILFFEPTHHLSQFFTCRFELMFTFFSARRKKFRFSSRGKFLHKFRSESSVLNFRKNFFHVFLCIICYKTFSCSVITFSTFSSNTTFFRNDVTRMSTYVSVLSFVPIYSLPFTKRSRPFYGTAFFFFNLTLSCVSVLHFIHNLFPSITHLSNTS